MTKPDDRPWVLAVVEQYEGPLTRYATRILGDLDRARDVVQDTFVRLCRQQRSVIEDHAAEWLYTVCRNRALDVCRKEGRMKTTDESGFVGLESPAPAPAHRLMRAEALGRVLSVLDALPARQQECIRLKFQDGLSYKEISRITSHSVSYVGVLIHNGMKTLRARLGALTPEV